MRDGLRLYVAGAVALLGLCLSGCAAAAEQRVDHTTSSVSLTPGEALVVDFGTINPTVGDAWVITREPDPEVLGPGEERSRYLGQDGEAGAPSEVSYRFPPAGQGTTVIQFEYQFRGEAPDDAEDRQRAEITVTVK
ncbi:protease inhibitor I42 family protein [Microbacterium sp. 3J1]|uniref:protease inhibitor I42 family protein n=1 Tax=Microbacterium sp. 3J1 TaxID=861269 RepID=UPI000A8A7F82|nr:protease inhibitor I42 family protein [Microbacterium sp. 3J1]